MLPRTMCTREKRRIKCYRDDPRDCIRETKDALDFRDGFDTASAGASEEMYMYQW